MNTRQQGEAKIPPVSSVIPWVGGPDFRVPERLLVRGLTKVLGGHAYDPASNPVTTTLPSQNGFVETRTFDRAGRLNQVRYVKGATTLADISYVRDPVGNPLSETRSGASPVSKTFQYDNMDRLTGVCYLATTCPGATDPFIRWTYDGVGNRLSEARPSVAATAYTYDSMDRMLTAGATSYTYDRNGNELSAGTRSFTYDLANRMKTTVSGSTTTTYTYDGDGVRTQASTGTAASAKTNFLWDVNNSLPMLAREQNGSGTLQRRYIYGQRLVFMATSASNAFFYHYDPLGSVRNVTNQTGATQLTYDYEPFGTVRTSSGSSPTNLVKFTGEYNDPTGLYHLRARQYDPTTGRFTSPDPLDGSADRSPGSRFMYVSNAPVGSRDASGLGEMVAGSLQSAWADGVASPGVGGGIDRTRVREYLRRWAITDNPKYRSLHGGLGGDCTNFVSQALHYGGWQEDATWSYRAFSCKLFGRWCSGGGTAAWNRVSDFVDYALESGRTAGQLVSERPSHGGWANAAVGDVLVFDWTGGAKFDEDHLAVINAVGPGGRDIWSSQHSTNRWNNPLHQTGNEQQIGSTDEFAAQGGFPHPTYKLLHVF